MFFVGKNSACGRIIDHRLLGGTIKSMNIDNIHEIHAPQIRGRVFFSGKTHLWLDHDHRVLGGTLKLMNIDNIYKIRAPNIQGRVLFRKNSACSMIIDHWVLWRETQIDGH